MEDLGALKWIAIVALVVYNAVRRSRKTAHKDRQRSRGTALGEAWPARAAQETAEKRIDTQPERVVSEHSARELPAEAESAMQPQPDTARRCKQPHNTRTPQAAKKPIDAAERPKNAEIHAGNDNSETFDLRQAVVMSEILRPKFDE